MSSEGVVHKDMPKLIRQISPITLEATQLRCIIHGA